MKKIVHRIITYIRKSSFNMEKAECKDSQGMPWFCKKGLCQNDEVTGDGEGGRNVSLDINASILLLLLLLLLL